MTNLYEEYKDDPKMLVAIAERERKISQMLEDIFFYKVKSLRYSLCIGR